jgi:hypothetical protein
MKLTTTLNRIRQHSPCQSGGKTLLKHLGKTESDDTEINLLTILDSNGVPDMLWCLRATVEDSKKVSSQLAIEFAEEALPIFEARYPNDLRPRLCLQACRDYLSGVITLEQLRKAREDAAYVADADAAADAAAYVAYVAAYVAYVAADASSAARQSARDRQAQIIRSILGN